MLARHARLVIYGCVALGIGLSLLLWPGRPDEPDPYAASIIKAHSRKMAADAQALREADSALAVKRATVTRQIITYNGIRYKTDTLPIHDTVWVKQVIAQGDSVVRACTELQSSCERFRVRAESVIAGLTLDRDALAAEVKASRPSGLRRAWDRVKLPLAFVGGVWVGSQAVR